jgi:hypothetical protein
MKRLRETRPVERLAVLYLVAVALNYAWELAQAPLYLASADWGNVWWHCFVAALGDGVMVWFLHVTGWLAFRRNDWFEHARGAGLVLLGVTGAILAVAVEWIGMNVLQRWAYDPRMPLVPGLRIGLAPLLQMVVLPPLILGIVAGWMRRRAAHQSSVSTAERSGE